MLNNIKVRRKRFIALLTAFAILLTTAAVTLGFHLKTRVDTKAGSQALSPIVTEDITLRGAFEKHFVREDGSSAAVSYANAVHYLSGGEWQEYDNTLEEVDGQDGVVLSNKSSPVNVNFAQMTSGQMQTFGLTQSGELMGHLDFPGLYDEDDTLPETEQDEEALDLVEDFGQNQSGNNLVGIEYDGYSLYWDIFVVQAGGNGALIPTKPGISPQIIKADTTGLSGDALKTAVTRNRSELVYRDVFGKDIDIKYTLLPSKVKEDFILKSKNDFTSYATKIKADKLSPVLLDDNSVSFNNAGGEAVFIMPSPYMTDSADEYSGDIAVSLEKSGEDEYTLTLTPDSGWLNDPQRVYPITIDPTVTSDNSALNIYDTYTHPGDTVMQYRLANNLRFGNRSGEINRTYIKHATLPNIPANTTITSAALTLTLVAGQSTWSNISVFPVNTDWTSTLCWAAQPSIGMAAAENVAPSNMVYTPNITAAVRSWYTGTANHGVMVRYHNESVNDYNSFYSSDWGVEPPSLTVNYENAADLQVASINAPSGNVGSSLNISAVINNTGTAAAGASTVQYVIKNSGGATVHTETASCGSVAAGVTVTAAAISWTPVTADTYTVTVTADCLNVIQESDESNNALSKSFTTAEPVDLNINNYCRALNWYYPLNPASGSNINIISPYNRGNPGFAVGCDYDLPVYAVDNGTVLETGYDDIMGNYVVIKTNSTHISGKQYTVWYTNLLTIDVNANAAVVKGTTVIGKTGTTGLSPSSRLGLYVNTTNMTDMSVLDIFNTVNPVCFWNYWGSLGHFTFGDLTGDGQTDELDLIALREHLLRNNLLSGSTLLAADLNEDNDVNISDLLLLKKYLLGNSPASSQNNSSQGASGSSSATSTSSVASSSSSTSSGTSTSSSALTSWQTDSDGFGPPHR